MNEISNIIQENIDKLKLLQQDHRLGYMHESYKYAAFVLGQLMTEIQQPKPVLIGEVENLAFPLVQNIIEYSVNFLCKYLQSDANYHQIDCRLDTETAQRLIPLIMKEIAENKHLTDK